jgi:hypothetical protein
LFPSFMATGNPVCSTQFSGSVVSVDRVRE